MGLGKGCLEKAEWKQGIMTQAPGIYAMPCGSMNRKDKTESRDISKIELIRFESGCILGLGRREKKKKS